jgi:HEAT repeat protein
MDTGPDGLRALLGYVKPPGLGDDAFARYAVSGLAKHVSRTDAASDRRMFEAVVLDELEAGRSPSVTVFFLHQLELIGSDRAVPVVERLLGDDELFEPAVEVLVAIQTPTAVQALRTALAEADEPSRQASLIQALGAVQEASVAEDLLPYAAADSWRVRRMALHALARSGAPAAIDALEEAVDTTRGARQRHARSSYLLLAERLVEEGHAAESAEIARRVLEENPPAHATQAALSALVQAEGKQALEPLLDAGTSPDQTVRRGALSLVRELPGREVTEAVLSRLDTADAPVRADVISMLGRRGDSAALSSLTPYLRDSDLQTRRAAVEAVTALGGAEVLPELLTVLNRAEESEVIGDVETALLQMPTDRVLPAAVEALPTGSDSTKAVLIRVIAERRGTQYVPRVLEERTSSEEAVRREVYRALERLGSDRELPVLVDGLSEATGARERAAVKDAIVAVVGRMEDPEDREEAVADLWEGASDAQHSALLDVLPRIGGDEALRLVVEATEQSEASLRTSAIEALAEWPRPHARALAALRHVAENADASEQRVELLTRYVNLVDAADASIDEKRERLHEAVSAAASPEEKALLLEAFSSVERPVALAVVGKYISDQEDVVRDRALDVAIEHLASFFDSEAASPDAEAMLAALTAAARPELARRLDRRLAGSRKIESPDPAESPDSGDTTSVALFNGENLEGWEPVGGSSGGWDVDDGVLYTDGSGQGWLSTERTYDDFELELEFRVPEGGNSGVFLRAPREGSPASAGLEIQILDDRAEQYADLEAWQYTGSIYAVKAPSKRASRPAGEWQKMKIVAEGPRIRVVLNGERIVNTSLVRHMDRVEEHPGLKRREGYVGLQNHGTRIEYRNVVIRELE